MRFYALPKNNYALKMVKKKYTVQEFFDENKEEIMKHRALNDYFTYDTITDFIDACVREFPKGTYWRPCDYELVTSIYLCTQNRSKYGSDFIDKAKIDLRHNLFKVYCFSQCADTQERLANEISQKFRELYELFIIEQI